MTPKLFLGVVEAIIADRGAQYGSPRENMQNIAKRWSLTLKTKITPEQVCLCMLDIKMARLSHGIHADSIQDIAGYAAVLNQVAYDD
jgi:hypothetical protein